MRHGFYPHLGNGNPRQYSCLGNPMDRGAWQATALGLQRVRDDWATNTFTFIVKSFILITSLKVYQIQSHSEIRRLGLQQLNVGTQFSLWPSSPWEETIHRRKPWKPATGCAKVASGCTERQPIRAGVAETSRIQDTSGSSHCQKSQLPSWHLWIECLDPHPLGTFQVLKAFQHHSGMATWGGGSWGLPCTWQGCERPDPASCLALRRAWEAHQVGRTDSCGWVGDEVGGVGSSESNLLIFSPPPPLGRKMEHLLLKASASERLGLFCLKDSLMTCL